jgi:hypothetical protein
VHQTFENVISALAGLIAFDRLVDHVKTAAAADDAIVPMTLSQRLDRILNLHDVLEMLPYRTRAKPTGGV